jgi:hypothetical protein
LTLPAASAAGSGWVVLIQNAGAGLVTAVRVGSDLIDAATSAAVPAGSALLLVCTGTGWVSTMMGAGAADGRVLRNADVQTTLTDSTPDRLMRVGAFGLGRVGAQVIMADLDAATTPVGFWRTADPGTANIASRPPGSGTAGTVLVMRSASLDLRQLWFDVTTAAMWQRRYRDAEGGWMPWRRIYDSGSILGTVGLSSGVPTGAILERGSNANGTYLRYADGTQMCWHQITLSSAIDNAFLGGFRSNAVTWTFPASFTATPRLTATPHNLGGFSGTVANAGSSTSATFAVTAVTTQTAASRLLNVFAVGDWA